MPQPTTHPLPPAALRVLAATAGAWGLCMCAPLPVVSTRKAPCTLVHGHAAHSTPIELQQWPYWPDYPGAAIGWR